MNTDDLTDDWVACPAGTLARLRKPLPSESRPAAVRPYAIGAALGLFSAAVVLGLSLVRGPAAPGALKGHLRCQEVMSLLPRYHTGALPVEVARNVRVHLSLCPGCEQKYRTMYPDASRQAARFPGGPLAFAF